MIDVVRVSTALSDPIRLRILDLLVSGQAAASVPPAHPRMPHEACDDAILPFLGRIGHSTFAQHMRVLQDSGLVTDRRAGTCVYYAANRELLEAYTAELARRFGVRGSTPPSSAASSN